MDVVKPISWQEEKLGLKQMIIICSELLYFKEINFCRHATILMRIILVIHLA
jgi:hypothetical protein